MKYFKIQNGFGPADYIQIDETELGMALRAQITGKIGIFKNGTIAGNHIISITPDWNRELGYKRDYKLTGEDYDELEGKLRDYQDFLELANVNASRQIEGLPPLERLGTSGEGKSLAEKLRRS